MKDLNGTQAVIRTGYSKNGAEVQASRLLANANIASYIAKLKAELAERTGITVDFVMMGFKEVAERCLQRTPVMRFDYLEKAMVQAKDENGKDIWQFDSQGANKAFEMMGKHVGAFETDNRQKNATIVVEIDE
jgi:phage terminase small subunit